MEKEAQEMSKREREKGGKSFSRERRKTVEENQLLLEKGLSVILFWDRFVSDVAFK